MKHDIMWWIQELHKQKRTILRKNSDIRLYTDASLEGWGAVCEGVHIGGRWSDTERQFHINSLELKAILFGLKSFTIQFKDKSVLVFSDNSTAVCYITNMGGIKSEECNLIAVQIWNWCIENNIWLTCSHIAGSLNCEADIASRSFNDKLEWKLHSKIFANICNIWGKPDIDLFATRLNAQTSCYCSWKPDPEAQFIDAFSCNWNTWNCVYLFPPFSLLGRCIQKVRQDQATGIVIAPLWPTQTWFPRLMEILVDIPIIILKRHKLLQLPYQDKEHPLWKKLKLIVCKVSGKVLENKVFQNSLPTYLCVPGKEEQRNSTRYSYQDGFATVVKGKSINFLQMWHK